MFYNKHGGTLLGFLLGALATIALFLINKYIYTFVVLPLC